jgi:subtilisin family serine protease
MQFKRVEECLRDHRIAIVLAALLVLTILQSYFVGDLPRGVGAQQQSEIQITLSSQSINFGDEVQITANITTPNIQRGNVTFQWSRDVKVWNNIIINQTIIYGSPKIQLWQPFSSGIFYLRAVLVYLVKNNVAPGYSTYTATSNTQVLNVLPGYLTLKLSVSSARLYLGDKITISSTIEPSIAKIPYLVFQSSKDNSTWHEIGRGNVSSIDMTSKLVWTPPSSGIVFVRAEYPGDKNWYRAESNSAQVSVKTKPIVTNLELQLSSTTVNVGKDLFISVQIKPIGLTGISIQSSEDGTNWQTRSDIALDNIASSNDSTILTFRWQPIAEDSLFMRAYFPGNSSFTASYSNIVNLDIVGESTPNQKQFTLEVARSEVVAGERQQVNFRFMPNESVRLLIISPLGEQIMSSQSISADPLGNGRFIFVVAQGHPPGTYTVNAILATTSPLVYNASDVLSSTTFNVVEGQPDPRYLPSISLQAEPRLKSKFVPGEVLVTFHRDVEISSDGVSNLVASLGGTIIQELPKINTIKIEVPIGAEELVISQLQASGIVEFVGQDQYIVMTSSGESSETPKILDPDYSLQKAKYELVNVPTVWRTTIGSHEVIVAVLDSGFDVNNPDLRQNIWLNNNEICDDGIDNDANNYKDDCYGWNFSNSTSNGHANNNIFDEPGISPECDGHGTHVAGIIAALNNDILGIGVSPKATIMPLKITGNNLVELEDGQHKSACTSDEATVAEAVIYAADNGADIMNLSFGCPEGQKCDIMEMRPLADAFRYAVQEKNVLLVAAAGNHQKEHLATDIDDWQDFSNYLIEVSSVTDNLSLADYSNSGAGVQLASPGSGVYSTALNDKNLGTLKSGTSMATPMVTGCAALLLSADPTLGRAKLTDILIKSAKDIGDSGRDDMFGYGLLDCNKAMSMVNAMPTLPGTPNEPPIAQDDSVTMSTDTSVIINVLLNDKDPDSKSTSGPRLHIVSITQPGHGKIFDNKNGTLTYVPNSAYNGADEFQYSISDAEGAVDSATVYLNMQKLSSPPSPPTPPSPSKCLIATAAFGSELAPQVQFLRSFRDNRILSTSAGSSFMTAFNAWYYSFSPYVADYERGQPWMQDLVKIGIYPLLGILSISEMAYSIIPGEFGALAAGFVSSILIGLVYIAPIGTVLLVKKKNLVNNRFTKAKFIIYGLAMTTLISASLTIIGMGYPSLLTVSTSLFVVSLLTLSTITSWKLLTKLLSRD